MEKELVFSFDLGTTSIGECVRHGSSIEHLTTHLIPEDTASIKEQAKRRRQKRSRIAHKRREEWWRTCAKEAGIETLETRQPIRNPKTGTITNFTPDIRMLREFPAEGDKTIYTSCLLRIALLQGVKLESWQVFKAIWSALQHRGYDKQLPWKRSMESKRDKDEKENIEAVQEYETELKKIIGEKQEFHFPCYLEAFKLGIWSPENPEDISGKIGAAPSPARNKLGKNTLIAPRKLVERELLVMLQNASLTFPALKGKELYVLYGPAEKPYASYTETAYRRFRGRDWEHQGILSQKVPRFDNRIIAKCRLIPRLNVCKAQDILHQEVVFLQALKNIRFFDENMQLVALDVESLNELYNEFYEKKSITKSKWEKIVKEQHSGTVHPNMLLIESPKTSGRSSFSRPALRLLKNILLSGKSPHFLHKELCKSNTNSDIQKGLVNNDYAFLLKMPSKWENYSIPDNRTTDSSLQDEERDKKISDILNKISNPIVRHRLKIFTKRLRDLHSRHGIPDKVIIELVRDTKTGFMSEQRKKNYIRIQKKNKEARDKAVAKLKELGMLNVSDNILLKMMLFDEQVGIDPYSLQTLMVTDLEAYVIDHIVPRARGGSDAYINKVLTTYRNNDDKGNKTPYEWLKEKNIWFAFVNNIRNSSLSKKKKALLVNEDACSLAEKYDTLAATAYIAKLAQHITALIFNWPHPLKNSKRRIFVANGSYTAKIRRKFGLDVILHPLLTEEEFFQMARKGEIEEKNRTNAKHHALDALVISLLPYFNKPFSGKSDMELAPIWFTPAYCKNALDKVIPEQITFKKPVLAETLYAKRTVIENGIKKFCFVTHFGPGTKIEDFYKLSEAKKYTPLIFDPKIRNDFLEKLSEEQTEGEWLNFIQNYGKQKNLKRIPKKESKVFKEGSPMEFAEIGKMRGQYYKDKREHKGQIVYQEKTGKWKVIPVYVFESSFQKLKKVKEKHGQAFFFHSQQLVHIANDCNKILKGVYILKTIIVNGTVKLSSLDGAELFTSTVNELLNTGKIRPFTQKK